MTDKQRLKKALELIEQVLENGEVDNWEEIERIYQELKYEVED